MKLLGVSTHCLGKFVAGEPDNIPRGCFPVSVCGIGRALQLVRGSQGSVLAWVTRQEIALSSLHWGVMEVVTLHGDVGLDCTS